MSAERQKAFCVFRREKCESVVNVKRDFRRKLNIEPPTAQSIWRWRKTSQVFGSTVNFECWTNPTKFREKSTKISTSCIQRTYLFQSERFSVFCGVVRCLNRTDFLTVSHHSDGLVTVVLMTVHFVLGRSVHRTLRSVIFFSGVTSKAIFQNWIEKSHYRRHKLDNSRHASASLWEISISLWCVLCK